MGGRRKRCGRLNALVLHMCVVDCPAVSLDLYNYTAGGGSPLYCVELLKQSFSVKKKAIGLFFGRIGILHA